MSASRRVGVVLVMALIGGVLPLLGAGSAVAAVSCVVVNVTRGTSAIDDLQAAIDAARPGDTLRIRGSCRGGFVVEKSLMLKGKAAGGVPPRLRGSHSERVLTIVGTKSRRIRVTVKGLAIVGGFAKGYGGGIRSSFADVHLKSAVVRASVAGQGGGIASRGRLTLRDSWTTENRAEGGGGIHAVGWLRLRGHSRVGANEAGIAGGIWVNGHLTLSGRSRVRSNQAYGDAGVLLDYRSTLVMRSAATVSGNVATGSCGGVFGASRTRIVLRDGSSIRHNIALREGGGIFTLGNVLLREHAEVVANTAGTTGGGILAYRMVHVDGHARVARNLAQRGAGIQMMGAPLLLQNHARVVENRAGLVGGGVLVFDYPKPTIRIRGDAKIRRNNPQNVAIRVQKVGDVGE